MAEPGIPAQHLEWETLLDTGPARPPQDIVDEVNASLGIGARRVRYPETGHVDAAGIRSALDLE